MSDDPKIVYGPDDRRFHELQAYARKGMKGYIEKHRKAKPSREARLLVLLRRALGLLGEPCRDADVRLECTQSQPSVSNIDPEECEHSRSCALAADIERELEAP